MYTYIHIYIYVYVAYNIYICTYVYIYIYIYVIMKTTISLPGNQNNGFLVLCDYIHITPIAFEHWACR